MSGLPQTVNMTQMARYFHTAAGKRTYIPLNYDMISGDPDRTPTPKNVAPTYYSNQLVQKTAWKWRKMGWKGGLRLKSMFAIFQFQNVIEMQEGEEWMIRRTESGRGSTPSGSELLCPSSCYWRKLEDSSATCSFYSCFTSTKRRSSAMEAVEEALTVCTHCVLTRRHLIFRAPHYLSGFRHLLIILHWGIGARLEEIAWIRSRPWFHFIFICRILAW